MWGLKEVHYKWRQAAGWQDTKVGRRGVIGAPASEGLSKPCLRTFDFIPQIMGRHLKEYKKKMRLAF